MLSSPRVLQPSSPWLCLFEPAVAHAASANAHCPPCTVFYMLGVLQIIGLIIHIPVAMVRCTTHYANPPHCHHAA